MILVMPAMSATYAYSDYEQSELSARGVGDRFRNPADGGHQPDDGADAGRAGAVGSATWASGPLGLFH